MAQLPICFYIMLEFYHLREKPFSLLPTPRFMYLSEQYLETKAKVLYSLKDRSASLYLHGPIGCGKTSLLRLMAQEIDEDRSTNAKYITAPNLRTANQLLTLICSNSGVKTSRSYAGSLRNFEHFLIWQAKRGRFPLILIDEAQNLNRDELKLVHYLLDFVSNEKVLLMIVLVGQDTALFCQSIEIGKRDDTCKVNPIIRFAEGNPMTEDLQGTSAGEVDLRDRCADLSRQVGLPTG